MGLIKRKSSETDATDNCSVPEVARQSQSFDEVFTKISENFVVDRLIAAMDELVAASRTAGDDARAAERAYYENAAEKKLKITANIDELDEQQSALQMKISEFRYPLAEAIGADDVEKQEEIRNEIKAFEIERVRISSEISLLNDIVIRGDEALYRAAKEAHDRFLEKKNVVYDAGRKVEAHNFKQLFKKIEKIVDNFSYESGYGVQTGVGLDLEKLEDHFHAEERAARREADKRMVAEYYAKNAKNIGGK